jgi:DNA-binding XRE family transcriptional regulator
MKLNHALGPDRAKVFDYVYGVETQGNAADSDTSGELAGKNILIERHSVEDAAEEFNSNEDQVRQLLDQSRKLLLKARKCARKVLELRAHAGKTQKQMATRLRMTESMISRLERGDHVPSLKTLCRIADACDLSKVAETFSELADGFALAL